MQGPKLFVEERFIDLAFRDRLVAIPIAETIVERLRAEWYRPGVADAVSAYFRTTNFDIELEQRHDSLFSAMTMPVLFLQGSLDPGQQPHEYERVTDWVTDGELRFVEAGHFLHLESPEEVNEILTDWLARNR